MAAMERQKADFIVSVGGDGTILRTIHKRADPVPILGINMDTVVISKAKTPARFVKMGRDGFYAKVKSKLT